MIIDFTLYTKRCGEYGHIAHVLNIAILKAVKKKAGNITKPS